MLLQHVHLLGQFITGTDRHIAGLGQLAEFTRNFNAHRGQPGHEGYLINEPLLRCRNYLQAVAIIL
jgi:hypothetical protein